MKFELPVETTGPVGDADGELLDEVDVELRELELEPLLDDDAGLRLDDETELDVGACDEGELETEELVLVTLDEVARLELEAVLTTIEDEFFAVVLTCLFRPVLRLDDDGEVATTLLLVVVALRVPFLM